MGNFSGNTFNKLNNYVSVRLQQGVPLLDADWNELDDIRRYELRNFLKWFVGEGIPNGNDGFRIRSTDTPSKDFIIKTGFCLVNGWEVSNPEENLLYSQQKIEDESADSLNPLPDPLPENITIYLDVWEREVEYTDNPVYDIVGINSSVRIKREWVVRWKEGILTNIDPIQNTESDHSYYILAIITPKDNLITNETITDSRRAIFADFVWPSEITIKDGKIGIGIPIPSDELDINGKLRVRGSAGSLQLWHGTSHGVMGTLNDTDLSIRTNNLDRLRISKTGNVGIGITNPSEKLDINGNLRVRGSAGSLKFCGDKHEWIGTEERVIGVIETDGADLSLQQKDKIWLHISNQGKVIITRPTPPPPPYHPPNSPYHPPHSPPGSPFPPSDSTFLPLGLNEAIFIVYGLCYSDGWHSPGFDYGEYFESDDGRAIPLATPVVLTENGKIRAAKYGETPIGITTENSAVVGNSYIEWPKKYLRDKYGRQIIEKVKEEVMVPKKEIISKQRQKVKISIIEEEVIDTEVVYKNERYCQVNKKSIVKREIEEPVYEEFDLFDSNGREIIGKHQIPVMETYEEEVEVMDENGEHVLVGSGKYNTVEKPKLNPEYDEKLEYISRGKRKEWNCVGLLGQLVMQKGKAVSPAWVKIKDLPEKMELWLVK